MDTEQEHADERGWMVMDRNELGDLLAVHVTRKGYLLDCERRGDLVELDGGGLFPKGVQVLWRRITPEAEPGWEGKVGLAPFVRLRLVVRDGRPEVEQVRVDRSLGDNLGPELTATQIRELPLAEIVDQAVHSMAQALVLIQAPPGRDLESLAARSDVEHKAMWAGRAAVHARKRRIINDELLQEVATIYESDKTGAPTAAVSEQLFTSHRNATRWVGLAREKGFLSPYGTEEKS